MKKRILLIGIVLIFLLALPLSIATLDDNTTAYYKSDTDGSFPDSAGSNTGIITQASYTASGKINGAYDYDGTGDYVDTTITRIPSRFSLSFWMKGNVAEDYVIGVYDGTYYFQLKIKADGVISSQSKGVDCELSFYTGNTDCLDNTWHHIVITADYVNAVAHIYLDSNDKALTTTVANSGTGITVSKNIFIGARNNQGSADNEFDGVLDEVAFFDKILTQTEVNTIYNSDSGEQYPWGGGGATSYFEVTAIDEWNSSSILELNLTLSNGTIFTTTNGTIKTDINSSDANDEVLDFVVSGTRHFDKSYSSYNTSVNLDTVLFQSEIDFSTYELASGVLLTVLNYTIDGMQNTTFHLAEGEHTVLVEKGGYYDLNHTFNVSALDNLTESVLDLYNVFVNLDLKDVITNNTIEKTSYVTVNLSGVYQDTFSNVNGSISFPSVNRTFNFTLWADDYAFRYESVSFVNITENISFTLYANNSVWITAVNFDSGNSLTNFSAVLYNDNKTYSDTSVAGTIMLNSVVSGVYTLRVSKSGYAVAEYPLTMTGGSHQNVVAYMVVSGATTIFTVVDSISGSIIEGATANMYKTINSSWVVVSSQLTDITGRVQFAYTPDIEYKFVLDATGYDQRIFYLKPLFSTYTVRLTPDVEVVPDLNIGSWVYNINNSGNFYDQQNNSFSVSITSGTGTIEYYNLSITNFNGSVIDVSCAVASGCSDDFLLKIFGADYNNSVTVEYWIKESGYSEKYFKKLYLIQNIYNPSTLWSWKDVEDGDGMGSLEKALVATILSIVLVGFVSIGSVMVGVPPMTVSGIVLGVTVEVMALVGFIPWYGAHLVALGCLLIVLFGRGEI